LEKIGSLESDLATLALSSANRFEAEPAETLGFSAVLQGDGEWFENWRW
jgi:hypothetical protein